MTARALANLHRDDGLDSVNSPVAHSPGAIRTLLVVIAGALGCWLVSAALLVNVELGDGYSTIANAEYFVGSSSEYFWQRGPLMALLMVPGEYLAQALALAPLDVRPHHAVMALLHAFYLIGVWRLLERQYGRDWATLVGAVAAIPTVVFFSYAPFISHDLLPGLILLTLLVAAHRFMTLPTLGSGAAMFASALALALIKQSLGVLPALVLTAHLLVVLVAPTLQRRTELSRLGAILGILAVAGVVCWLAYAAVIGNRFSDVSFFYRPLAMVQAVATNYDGKRELDELFYRWVYFRNLSAYGILTMTLVLPGIGLALWRGDRLLRVAALTWLFAFAALQATPFQEVRYLAVLAPVSALLIIPIIRLIFDGPTRYRWLVLVVLLVDLGRALPEATRITDPFYRDGVSGFFEPLEDIVGAHTPVFFGIGWLSFVAPEADAFFGDPFHRITEMQIDQIRVLHHWSFAQTFRIRLGAIPSAMAAHPEGVFLLQNNMLARAVPFRAGNLANLRADHFQTLSRVERVSFRRQVGTYVPTTHPQLPRLLVRAVGAGAELVIFTGAIDAEVLRRFAGFNGLPDQVELAVLTIERLCQLNGCQRFSAGDGMGAGRPRRARSEFSMALGGRSGRQVALARTVGSELHAPGTGAM